MYYAKYLIAALWLSLFAAIYGAFMWMTVLIASVEADPFWWILGKQAFTYAFLLVLGAMPLFILLERDRARN
jgi:hypothetical protein